VSLNRRTDARARTLPIAAADARPLALVSLLTVLSLALILSAGAAWLSGP